MRIEVSGAPVDQGRAQGEALRAPVRATLAALRSHHTGVSWWAARRRARLGPGRAVARFFPWQAERIEGIALGAGLPASTLHLGERACRVRGVARAGAAMLYVSLDVPPELEPMLLLRASIPDAGGFASLELTCAHWASCLCGINSEGIAVLCADDRARGEPSVRFLAQELLFRARDLRAGIEHLRRRASYAGGTGTLLVAAPGVPARWLQLENGAVRDTRAEEAQAPLQSSVAIDCAARRLIWSRTPGIGLAGEPPETPVVRG